MQFIEQLSWLVLLLPLCAAALITLFTLRDAAWSAFISITAVVISFLFCVVLFYFVGQATTSYAQATGLVPFSWLAVGDFKVEISMLLDPLSALMLLIVTGVGGAIHIYSWGYMREDPAAGRFFAGLSLFTFSMLGIVMASNLVMMFIFWELVGVSSYLLIGFWYEKASAADACKKAFITNRLGDFGFLLGIIVIWATMGSVDIPALQGMLAHDPGRLGAMACVAGLLIFCGAVGKSAQFPLHVWLPDAMEGPTPVSALIHAATMVAAGVYMLCRVFFLFTITPAWPEALAFLNGCTALNIIAWIGGFTALLAALIAVQQNDIKRILAYSTLSQLGYMIMAVGLATAKAGPNPAMFHLTTHAFFKALLFLGSGSVIMAMHHEQDIWKMGALRKKLPVTWLTFLVGTLAICGVLPLSGFYSKDAILAQAFEHNRALFVLAVFVAALTSFYMFRLLFVVFVAPARDHHAEKAHESPRVMTWPLVFLAVLSAVGGLIGIEGFIGKMPLLGGGGEGVPFVQRIFAPFHHAPLAAGAGILAAALGFVGAFALYRRAANDPLPAKLGCLSVWMRDKFYFDELYAGINGLTHEALAKTADWFDRWIVSGLGVRGVHGTTEFTGRALRLLQTGNLQTYAFLLAAGLVVVLWAMLK